MQPEIALSVIAAQFYRMVFAALDVPTTVCTPLEVFAMIAMSVAPLAQLEVTEDVLPVLLTITAIMGSAFQLVPPIL